MIKKLIIIILLALSVMSSALTQQSNTTTTTLTFVWDSNTETDLAGYGFYVDLNGNGTYEKFEDQIPVSNTDSVTFEAVNVVVNINEPTYFSVDAFDTAGNRSDFAEPCEYIHCVPLPAETRTLSCPDGYTGTGIVQTRSSSCSFDSYPVWSSWVETSRNCSVVTPPPSCTTSTETRTRSCDIGYTGQISESRTSTCPDPNGAPVWPDVWTETSNTCKLSETNECQVSTETKTETCGYGYNGVKYYERSSTCPDPYGNPVWGEWVETDNTCTDVTTGEPKDPPTSETDGHSKRDGWKCFIDSIN